MADFLFEIGLEEVPARMIPAAEAELLRRTVALLERERLITGVPEAQSFSTPRRLAVLVKGVATEQPDITEETTGPAVKIAFKDGVPAPAAEAFAKKSGVAVTDLRTITTPKGEYLAATSIRKGRSASEVIAAELPKEVAAIYWAKNMRWIPGSNEKFVRPVLWLVALLGDEVVPVSFAGKTAGRSTYGHRILSSGEPFDIVAPDSYVAQLEGEYVLADVEARRHKIRKSLDHICRKVVGARWREDVALVDKMTHLTEWPDVLLGDFEAHYLALPEEVLVTVMRDHQNYFAIESADHKLAPHFLAVLNIALDDVNAPIIKQGNERVLRARFNDARFFWEFDQRISLFEREEMLKSVTFQKDLGSYWDKSQAVLLAVRGLAAQLAINGQPLEVVEQNGLELAARLAKTDLTSELVKEFTELQGKIGGLYAKAADFSETVSQCLYFQYEPVTFSSDLPPSTASQLLSLADKLNTIVDMFALRNIPTGSKDPFALRRAASGVAKILAEGQLKLTLWQAVDAVASASKFASSGTREEVSEFIYERFEHYLVEIRGFEPDVVAAAHFAGWNDFPDMIARAEALRDARGSADFIAVCEAFKRMKNIVVQADNSGITSQMVDFPSEPVVMHPAQNELNSAVFERSMPFANLCKEHNYADALKLLATIRPYVDAFMDPKTGVRVMDDDPYIRETRLNLLRQTLKNFSVIADFSEIVTAG